jgi:DNA-binding NtrC family response regulator
MLIVDDYAATRDIYARLFDLKGWQVRCAASVQEAIRELDPAPDCMILDLSLPGGGGEAVLEAAERLGLSTRVVVVSGISTPARLQAVQERFKPVAVFTKPVAWDILCAKCEGTEQNH